MKVRMAAIMLRGRAWLFAQVGLSPIVALLQPLVWDPHMTLKFLRK